MKKSKVILAIALAVILLVTCLSAPTFSWFTRPYPSTAADYTGNVLNLITKKDYTAYNGYGVAMTTTACTTGAAADYASVTTAAGLGGSNIGTGDTTNRKYYCTTITNSSGSTAQNISLYVHALQTNTTQFAIGVNSPMRTYHDFVHQGTGVGVKADYPTRRVYFERPTAESGEEGLWTDWTTTGNYDCAYWTQSQSIQYCSTLQWVQDYDHYYFDVPYSAYGFIIKIPGAGYDEWYKKTENIEAHFFNNEITYLIKGQHRLDSNNYHTIVVEWNHNSGIIGANFTKYYSTITMDPNSTFDASLRWPDVQGSVTYSSSDTSVFTVDSNGIITSTPGSGTRTATLTTTTEGDSYHDTKTATTTVTVQANQNGYDYTDEPIVKNISVPAYAGRGQDGDPAAVKVYWYIKNNSNSSLTYTIDRIYLGP